MTFILINIFCYFLVEKLHAKLSVNGYTILANSLLSYFLLNKDFDKATIISKELEHEKFIQYRQLLADIRLNNNIDIGYKLLEIIPILKGINQNSNIGLVYSAIIDSYGWY